MFLAFLVYKAPGMKLGSCCREGKMQLSSPTLRSLANFDIESEQFTVHIQREKPVHGTSGLAIDPRFIKMFSNLQSWSTDPKFVCVCR